MSPILPQLPGSHANHSVCMVVCMYICVYVCMCGVPYNTVYLCTYECMYVCLCVCSYKCDHLSVHLSASIWLHAFLLVFSPFSVISDVHFIGSVTISAPKILIVDLDHVGKFDLVFKFLFTDDESPILLTASKKIQYNDPWDHLARYNYMTGKLDHNEAILPEERAVIQYSKQIQAFIIRWMFFTCDDGAFYKVVETVRKQKSTVKETAISRLYLRGENERHCPRLLVFVVLFPCNAHRFSATKTTTKTNNINK